jgi:serine/threonine-protein kinase
LNAYIGQVVDGRYLVEELLGEGGMGFVYLARHQVIDKRVAIKILRGELATDQEMADRFLNEARAASSVGNPHIVDISDFGRLDDGATYFVMEYLDGKSLAKLMRELRVISVPRIVHIAKQIARGLAATHARGIVHRDLKPDNVMLVERGEDKDFVKILDFGIAKVSGEAGRLTRAGSVFGTPHYMSPEQAAGVPVDARTDIYSLGVILYEMASGKVPFDADNFMGILTQHMYKAPVPIRALVPQPQEVPPGLEAIVLKCLSKKTELRYQSMEELVADLEKAERGHVPDAVAEMMARSGGFNVPVDYFRNPQRSPGGVALMPATPTSARPRRSLLIGVLAGMFLLFGVVGLVFGIGAWRSSASADMAASAVVAAPPRASEAPPPAAESAAAPPALKPVQIVAAPIDAVVFQGTNSLGVQPQIVSVGPDEKVTIRVERAGYKSETRTIDGSQSRVEVKLEREASKASAPKIPPKPSVTAAPPPKPSATTPPPPPKCPPGQVFIMGSCTTL